MPTPKLITAFLSLSFYGEVFSRYLRAEHQDAPSDLHARRLTGPESTEFQVTASGDFPSIAALIDGGFVISWRAGRSISGQRYVANGGKNGPEFNILNTELLNPVIAALFDGGFVVSWTQYDYYGPRLFGQRFAADGSTNGAEFFVKDDNSFDGVGSAAAIAALSDGGFVVISLGIDNADIFGQRYALNGSKNGAEFLVSSTERLQSSPAIALLSNGEFVIIWENTRTIWENTQAQDSSCTLGQRYTANWIKKGAEFQVNNYTRTGGYPDIVSLIDGGFVVVWSDDEYGGYNTFGQRYTINGIKNSTEFQVNNYTNSNQMFPAIAPLTDGGFVLVWQSDAGIFGQQHTVNGVKNGIEFQVTNYTQDYEYYGLPAIAALNDGGFVMIWGGNGIFGQRFDANGNKIAVTHALTASPTSQPTLRLGPSRSSHQPISMGELIGFSAAGLVMLLLIAASLRWMLKYFQQKASKKNSAYELAPPNAAELGSSHQSSHQSSRRIVPEETLHQSALPIHFTGSGAAHTTKEANSDPRPIETPIKVTPAESEFAAPPQPLKIDRGDIRLDVQLGKGHYGTVHKAEWATQFQTVAVKSFTGDRLPERIAEDVEKEVGIMMRLQHDCLIRFYGLVQDELGPPMVVMEYGEKGSLYHFLHSKQEISSGLRLRMAHELARGLAYLHHKKILHRDLKSLNVVLDQDYHAKLCDFGLAILKLHSDSTTKAATAEPFEIAGTSRWMAPELFSRKTALPSHASDVWGLGMIFFEIITREIPYKDVNKPDDIARWIIAGEKENISEECSRQMPGFEAIIHRCWAERTMRPKAKTLVTDIALLIEASTTVAASQVHPEPAAGTNTTASHNPYRKR